MKVAIERCNCGGYMEWCEGCEPSDPEQIAADIDALLDVTDGLIMEIERLRHASEECECLPEKRLCAWAHFCAIDDAYTVSLGEAFSASRTKQ